MCNSPELLLPICCKQVLADKGLDIAFQVGSQYDLGQKFLSLFMGQALFQWRLSSACSEPQRAQMVSGSTIPSRILMAKMSDSIMMKTNLLKPLGRSHLLTNFATYFVKHMGKTIPLASPDSLPGRRKGKSSIKGSPEALLMFLLIMLNSNGMLMQTLQPLALTKIQCLRPSRRSSGLSSVPSTIVDPPFPCVDNKFWCCS